MQPDLRVLVGMACAIAGCVPMTPAAAVRNSFATAYACPEKHVTVRGDDSDAPFEADGCGHHDVYSCANDSISDKLMGAIRCRTIREIAMRTVADRSRCPVDELAATAEPSNTSEWARFSITGCGRTVVMSCSHHEEAVTQVVEGEERTSDELRWACVPRAQP